MSPEDDASFVEDEARVPAATVEELAHVGQAIVEAAGRNVGPDVRCDPSSASLHTLEREPGAAPVGLSGHVVVDLLEPERLEPRRGSWAQVSLRVVAVDDHRAAALETLNALAVELLSGMLIAAGRCSSSYSSSGSTSTSLRLLLGEQPLNVLAVDRRWHQLSVSTWPKTAASCGSRLLDRDHIAARVRMLGKPAVRVRGGGEEVEHRATAAVGVGLSIEHPGDDDRSRRRPLGGPVGSHSCPDRITANGVARGDLDRLRRTWARSRARRSRTSRPRRARWRSGRDVRSAVRRRGRRRRSRRRGRGERGPRAASVVSASFGVEPSRPAAARISSLPGGRRLRNGRRIQE